MRSTTPFRGVKELRGERGDFRFMAEFANAYIVLKRIGPAFVRLGILDRKKRETNKSLYSRAAELWENLNWS